MSFGWLFYTQTTLKPVFPGSLGISFLLFMGTDLVAGYEYFQFHVQHLSED